MINLNHKIKLDSRDKLYYDRYEFCLQLRLEFFSSLRHKSHKTIDLCYDTKTWMRDVNYGGSWRNGFRLSRPITPTMRDNCHLALDELQAITVAYKLVISEDFGYIYTNDLGIFANLSNSPGVTVEEVKKASLDRPRDTLIVKNSKHQKRTYFKNQHIKITQKDQLYKFLSGRDEIRLGPGFVEWFEKFPNNKYICDNYFIDYNDDGFLTMLGLVSPIKIKRTVQLLNE